MNLKQFYDNKYTKAISASVIDYNRHPISRYEAAVKYFSDNFNGESILEIGCGNGCVAHSILKHANVSRYVATDLSNNRLKGIAKTSRLEVMRIDAERFDFSAIGTFDAIIMIAVIEHLVDPLKVMRNIKAALKPGGFVYIDTPNIADYGSRFKLLTGRFPSTASKDEGLTTYDNHRVAMYDEGHLHYFTYRSLAGMMLYAGFASAKYHYPVGRLMLGRAAHYLLSRLWPEMFSPVVLICIHS